MCFKTIGCFDVAAHITSFEYGLIVGNSSIFPTGLALEESFYDFLENL